MSHSARDPLRHIIGTCSAQVLAFSPAILSPLTVGSLINGLQIGEVEAGALVTVEFLVMGITSILVAPVSVRISYRLLALAGGILLLTGHALTITLAVWTDSVIVLGLVAFFEAVLFIIMIPLMLTLAAGIEARGRWAAIAGGVFVISTAIGPVIGAFLIEETGYDAIAWIQWPAVLLAVGIFVWVNRSRVGKRA